MFGFLRGGLSEVGQTLYRKECRSKDAEERLRRDLPLVLTREAAQLDAAEGATEFAVAATVGTIHALRNRTGITRKQQTFEQKFLLGLFAFLTAHNLGQRMPVSLGNVFAASALEIYTPREISDIYQLGRAFRRLRQEKKIYGAINETIIQWLDAPSEDTLDELVAAFQLCSRPN